MRADRQQCAAPSEREEKRTKSGRFKTNIRVDLVIGVTAFFRSQLRKHARAIDLLIRARQFNKRNKEN
jgi:hypothetical protein